MSGEQPPGAGAAGGTGPSPSQPQGPDLVRAALAQARAAARARGVSRGTPGRSGRRAGPARSGSGPDARDPVPFGAAIRRLVEDRGWQDTSAAASVLARWEELVGPELAAHCRPASLLEGQLVLVAESSAWATQLRLLTRTLQARLGAHVGPGVVTSVVVRGPAQPDWHKGPRRVRGRGPRDTYG